MSPVPRRWGIPEVAWSTVGSKSPEVVGRERENTDHTSYPIVCETMMKEGAMTAIVLNHEQPHEKACSRHREQRANPVTQ